ncbi:MAG: amino acid ABC transporter permease [Rhodospirillales bacterium]|nr:amino acid ABC transporter permease [Rhodospirillales bacterium]
MLAFIAAEIPRLFTIYNVILLAKAAVTTLSLSAVGCVVGLLCGTLLTLARMSRRRSLWPLKALAFLYIEIMRRIPFLVTLMTFYFGAQVLGFNFSPLEIAFVSTSVISTAFVAEIVRTGLQAVKASQIEAAEVMNFSVWQSFWLVRLPQAWPIILPPVFGYFVLFIKDTALASQAGVLELTQAAKILNTKGFSASLVYATVLLLYFVISYPLARLGGHLEKRLGTARHSRSRRTV